MTEHSKEPWGLTVIGDCNRIRITDADGFTIANLDTEVLEGKQPANAKRMRTCVNALAGLNPEHVGELVEAARKAVALNVHDDWCDECGDTTHTPDCVIAGLQAALAKVQETAGA